MHISSDVFIVFNTFNFKYWQYHYFKLSGDFFESVEGMDISSFEAVGKLENFVNKQLKHQKLISNYFSTLYSE